MRDMHHELVLERPKSGGEVVRVRADVFRGRPYVDVRCWRRPITPGGECKPTVKGIKLNYELWAEIVPVIADLIEGQEPAEEEQ